MIIAGILLPELLQAGRLHTAVLRFALFIELLQAGRVSYPHKPLLFSLGL